MRLERNLSKEAEVRTSFAPYPAPTVDWCDTARVTIDVLPDVALLEIFDSYVDKASIEAWHTLVHVCQKWRTVVFGSSHRLNLRLYCSARTPVKEMLDVWPLLPIIVWGHDTEMWGTDNIVAALEHNNHLCNLHLVNITSLQLENVLTEMQQPIPALTVLELQLLDERGLIIRDSFLGGFAPRLQTLILNGLPFPGLPKLLLSATDLVHFTVWGCSLSGYISPEAMVTCLSALTRLETVKIGFKSPRCRPEQNTRRPPPLTRTLLPVLTELRLKGVNEYLEDFVARIDAPQLNKLAITFFHQLILDTPHLTQFISRTPNFMTHNQACLIFSDWDVGIVLPQRYDGSLSLVISCSHSDWQLSSLAPVCSLSLPQVIIPAVEHLYIFENRLQNWQQNDIENSQWLELLRPFTAVKGLYISSEFTSRVAPALQELVGSRVSEVLPALQGLFLEEPLPSGHAQEAIGEFVAARQLSRHPISVSHWKRR